MAMEEAEEEVWARCYEPIAKYSVSTLGAVRNDNNGKVLKPSVTASGYYYTNLTHRGKTSGKVVQRKYYSHRLLAECHLPNPDSLPSVDHINRQKLDNRICNLRWCSASDQIRNQDNSNRKKSNRRPVHQIASNGTIVKTWPSCGDACQHIGIDPKNFAKVIKRRILLAEHVWDYADRIENEDGEVEWREFLQEGVRSRRVLVSNTGLVKRQLKCGGHRLVKLSWGSGYLRIGLWCNGAIKMHFVHRMVASCFIARSCATHVVVNHKDGDKSNNVVSNLEWTSYAANSQHAATTGLMKFLRPVDQLSLNGTFMRSFASVSEAARATGQKKPSGIYNAMSGKYITAGGFKWRDQMS